ncbi:unnamed protein product [Urochloa humidicola]
MPCRARCNRACPRRGGRRRWWRHARGAAHGQAKRLAPRSAASRVPALLRRDRRPPARRMGNTRPACAVASSITGREAASQPAPEFYTGERAPSLSRERTFTAVSPIPVVPSSGAVAALEEIQCQPARLPGAGWPAETASHTHATVTSGGRGRAASACASRPPGLPCRVHGVAACGRGFLNHWPGAGGGVAARARILRASLHQSRGNTRTNGRLACPVDGGAVEWRRGSCLGGRRPACQASRRRVLHGDRQPHA